MFVPTFWRSPKGLGILTVACVGLSFSSATLAQPALSVGALGRDFAAMAGLQELVAQGSGKIAVLFPTATAARYPAFDEPFFRRAFETAGLGPDQYEITDADYEEATQLAEAQSAIARGATVLILDPISTAVGVAIETYASERGVHVIDYDRLTLGGSRSYFVGFDAVAVGTLIGEGMVSCIDDWGVENAQILVMLGAPVDDNSALIAQGYLGVLQPHFDAGDYTNVGEPAGTWDPAVARTTFEQQLTAHDNINAVVTPNDNTADAIIAYLKTLQVPPRTIPTTGQDATPAGLQNVLAGYQCGTVYKRIYLEAQAAVALALYLRAGLEPPAGLINGTMQDTQQGTAVPSVLLPSLWVTPENMNATIVADDFVSAAELCTGDLAAACRAAGITP
jgi:D-xylose transport system substrate-binding protein